MKHTYTEEEKYFRLLLARIRTKAKNEAKSCNCGRQEARGYTNQAIEDAFKAYKAKTYEAFKAKA